MTKNLIIIGDGLASWGILLQLAKRNKDYFDSVIQISNDQLFEACSNSSTATAALRGVKKGHSLLGDTIVESFHYLRNFVLENELKGISRADFFHLSENLEPRFQKMNEVCELEINNFILNGKKYLYQEQGFLFDPSLFKSFVNSVSQNLPLKKISALVTGIRKSSNNWIVSTENDEYSANNVLICTGAYDGFFPLTHQLRNHQSVHGSYYETFYNLGDQSFNINYNKSYFIYNHMVSKIMIGTSSRSGATRLGSNELEKSLYELQRIISHSWFSQVKPDAFKIKAGIRQKSFKRMPYLEQVDTGLWKLGGFYKNGFIFFLYYAHLWAGKVIPQK